MRLFCLPLAVTAALPLCLVAETPTQNVPPPASPPPQSQPAENTPKTDQKAEGTPKDATPSASAAAKADASPKSAATADGNKSTEARKAPAPAPANQPVNKEGVPTLPSIQQITEETSRLNAEKDRLIAQIALAQAKLDLELAPLKQNTERFNAQIAERKARQELEELSQRINLFNSLVDLRAEVEKATLTANLAKARVETELSEIRQIENILKRDTAHLIASMELEEKQLESRNFANNKPIYLENPLQGNRLVLSDRRIPLNGVITMKTASDVVDQINYFNNRDRKMPIFIVIDDCPGGSVMAGYKILKSMHGSQAPVYVVVRSFAASMAACITTLADKSFAYPNAVMLHHQISSFSGGNLTQQQEWVKEMEEWWKRLAGPVADKMGISREEFIKLMYEHSSSGDWKEFADQAHKLKWVDTIVEEIEETGILRLNAKEKSETTTTTTRRASTGTTQADSSELVETIDAKGRPSMVLPRLNPFDCYWLYNPDGYYKLP